MASVSPYELMHLADSALPAGGYAFSAGLESAYRLGLLRDESRLEQYLEAALAGAATGDMPFVVAGMEAADEELDEAVAHYGASLSAPAQRRASLVLGRNWLRLLEGLYPEGAVGAVSRFFRQRALPLHFAPVFGRGLASLGWDGDTARRLFLFQVVRDQLSAAVRLGAVGPMAGNRLQLRLYRRCRLLHEANRGRHWMHACRGAPLIDLAQLRHDRLYTRLFQS